MATQKVTSADFEKEVLQSDKPVVVDFYTDWCGPCKTLAPVLDQIADEKSATVKVVKVNVDEAKDIAAKFSVRSIPTLMVFKEGKVVGHMLGVKPKTQISAWIDESAAKPASAAIDVKETSKKREDETMKSVVKASLRISFVIGTGFSALTAIGGTILAATAASGPVLALGAAAAAVGSYRTYLGARSYRKAAEITEKAIEFAEKKRSGNAGQADVNLNKEELKNIGVPTWVANPVVQTLASAVTFAAGVALFSVGGFLPTAAALFMAVTGGASTMMSIAAGIRATRGFVSSKSGKATVADKNTGEKPAAPGNEPAPKSKLDDASAQKDFTTAANNNEPEKKPEAPKQDKGTKPPSAAA